MQVRLGQGFENSCRHGRTVPLHVQLFRAVLCWLTRMPSTCACTLCASSKGTALTILHANRIPHTATSLHTLRPLPPTPTPRSWLTLLATEVAFTLSLMSATSDVSIWVQIWLVLGMGAVVALSGMWVSLQFKWIHMHHPAVALVFERCVITGSLPAAAMMNTLGLAVLVAPSDTPFYLAAILSILYAALGTPLVSSFHNARAVAAAIGGGGAGASKKTPLGLSKAAAAAPTAIIQSRTDSAVMALLTTGLPAAVYAAMHWAVLGRSAVHVYALLLLACVPAVVVALLPAGLWWVPGGHRVQRWCRGALLVSVVVVVVGGGVDAERIGYGGR